MYAPTTQWDRGPTDKELLAFWGKEESQTHAQIIETLTDSIRKVPASSLSLPFVSFPEGNARLGVYALSEVVTDYGVYGKALAALLLVLEKSDCPLVAAYRQTLAKTYADEWSDAVDEVQA